MTTPKAQPGSTTTLPLAPNAPPSSSLPANAAGLVVRPFSQPAPPSKQDTTTRFTNARQPEPAPGKQAASADASDQLTLLEMLEQLSTEDLKPPARAETAKHTGAPGKKQSEKPDPGTQSFVDMLLQAQESDATAPERHTTAQTPRTLANEPAPLRMPSPMTTGDGPVQAPHELRDVRDILRREPLLNRLLNAVEDGEWSAIDALLAKVPAGVEHLEHYLPPAPLTLPYDAILAKASAYDDRTQTASSHRLLMFITDCKLRCDAQHQVVRDHKGLTNAAINKTYAPEVRDLCLALRNTSALQLNAKPQEVVEQIRLALQRPRLVQALAMQPYADLRALRLKCEVLATRLDPQLVGSLIASIEEARALQTNASLILRDHLLQEVIDPRRVATLALVEYAKQMTSAPIDHVSAGATWDEISDMHGVVQEVLERFVAMPPETVGVELAAIRWVAAQIGATHHQAPASALQDKH